MSGSSKLRWAHYEGVYQPALHIPSEEITETELPAGYSAVYLLGLDSTVMVPDSDLSPYDPHDTAKASHPAAALGVATAQQILDGFQASEDDGAAGSRHAQQWQQDDEAEGPSCAFVLEDEDKDDDDLHGRRSGSRRRHEEKQRKKAAKESKKAAKATVKREREEITSAPTVRHRDVGDDSDSEDAEDHYRDGDDDDSNDVRRAMAIESRHKPERGRGATRGDDAGSRSGKKLKKERDDGAWTALEAELFSDEEAEDDDGEDGVAGGSAASGSRRRQRGLRSGSRMGQALSALNMTRMAPDIPGLSTSCPHAYPYLMEIDYEYRQLAQEAANEGLLLTKEEGDVVREIDAELRSKAADRMYLQSVLEQRLRQQQQQQGDEETSRVARSEIDALSDSIEKLDAPLSVATAVRRLVSKQVAASTAAFDRYAAVRARRAVQRRTRTFQDASVIVLLEQLRATAATPREDGAEVMRKYVQQRRQHEDMKLNMRGLSKTGFYAVPKPLEKWKRGRDMMLLLNAGAEAQKVRPTSYISQAYSTMRERIRDHAEKCFERIPVAARDGASFLDPNSFTGTGTAFLSTSSTTSFAVPLMERQQQRRLNASNAVQRREAFFQFHCLRCDTEAPVTVETVPLNASFAAGSTLAPGVLEAADEAAGPGSRATSVGRGGEDASVHTEDGTSLSYSAHSAAPSSYPYLFDNEPRARRAHHRRSSRGSVSGLSSDVEGPSVHTSRATSVASAYSENAEDDQANEHRRRAALRRGAAATTASMQNGTAGTTTADWRTNAKRSIMEQLTLYRRGKHGKPAVLNDEQCREMCRLLLDRAMRAEAERQGLSLAVQSNNIAARFTKVTEQRLKKSVDHYLERQIRQGILLSTSTNKSVGVLGASALSVLGDGAELQPGILPTADRGAVLPHDTAAEARQRAVADTPIFED
ncbi:hypothetical protein GH5_07546 [Leishmania sp. Ghana 2012 LV757]|uniref:hypothetical protein n=1 Tax=Leishmania sp. Ghana 2012 LV757 TaxID=2803181 RepID=UPI001B4636E0|nr:hypothetical protein GH5_07546 [Leishmania sp. Ghana 2012 LV757]